MKRAIITSLLMAAAVAAENTSYAQGSLIFANYAQTFDYTAPVTWFGGLALDRNYTAQLFYSSTGMIGTFAPVAGATSQFFANTDGDTADGAGFFMSTLVTIPSYTSGNAYFEIGVFCTGGGEYISVPWYPYPLPVPAGVILGVSPIFVYSTLATSANGHVPGDPFPDNPDVVVPLEPFVIALVPEPTSIALSALGLVFLVAYRFRGSHQGFGRPRP